MKRLFIEIADEDNDTLTTISLDSSARHRLEMTDSFFDTVIHNANKNKKDILDAIKTHDEIYASTAFYPLGEETSGDLFNNLMQYAIATNIEGKKVYLWREYNQIRWTELDIKLLRNCFTKNNLYVKLNDDNWEQVNIKKLIKNKFA